MNFLPNKVHMALNAALFVAYHGNKAEPVSGSAIAQHYGLGCRTLEPVLQVLGNAGFLQSIRGQGGGYYIESPDKVNIKDIAECFIHKLLPECSAFSEFSPVLEQFFKESYQCFWDKLSGVTLQDLCNASEKEGLPRIGSGILTFEI